MEPSKLRELEQGWEDERLSQFADCSCGHSQQLEEEDYIEWMVCEACSSIGRFKAVTND